MSDQAAQIAGNLGQINERIEQACARSGRHAADVGLVAVTKYAQEQWVQALVDQGVTTLGENRPQQLVERSARITGPVEWHLIGHLQRNKVRLVLPHVRLIHSVDSLRLARRINDVAGELSQTSAILLETNVSGESSKDGFTVERLLADWEELASLSNVAVSGLMTMAPAVPDPEAARPAFEALRQLRDQLRSNSTDELTLPELSMGMSGDFEVAIEEGATLVRIGSALFRGLA